LLKTASVMAARITNNLSAGRHILSFSINVLTDDGFRGKPWMLALTERVAGGKIHRAEIILRAVHQRPIRMKGDQKNGCGWRSSIRRCAHRRAAAGPSPASSLS